MNIDIQEIFCCHDWAIEPIAGRQLYNALMAAIANQREGKDSEGMQKTAGFFLSKNKSFAGKLFVGDIHRIENRLYWNDEELAEDDQIVNVVVIEGAVTRNGGACTYGSKEHRDQILYANTIPQVVGHLFLINTPGGMVPAAADYTMAFENCHENNKPTVALIDGMCYSMGEWIACSCDYVIAMNPEDGFGCIGTMCVGELAPHGSINAITQERTIILVGKGSPDKNREAIEAAQGNDELMQAQADKETERFHQVVKQNRPMVTDDLLTGKTFKAQEVLGTLVDEIGGMDRAIEVIFQLADGSMTPARQVSITEKPDVDDTPGTPDQPEGPEAQVLTPQNDNIMTDEEKKAAEAAAAQAAAQEPAQEPANEPAAEPAAEPAQEPAAGEGAQEPAGEGAQEPAQEPAAEPSGEGAQEPAAEPAQEPAQEPAGEGAQEPAAEPAQEPAAEPAGEGTELAQVQDSLHTAEQMIAEKDQTIASLKESLATLNGIAEERDAAIKERNDLSASLEKAGLDYAEQGKELADAQAKIAEHVATIETLKKQVADLKAEVKELAGKPAPMTNADSGVPQDNGTGEAPKQKQRYTREMSYEESRALAKQQAEEAGKK